MTHQVLIYSYVEDVLERRAPHREAHLAMIRAAKEDGRIVMSGPIGDPPNGALIVFTTREAAEEFVGADPYVEGGVVTEWRVEPWTLV
ncbi:MAG TPA: YciI family protein [Solirubrobacteraceae bacterium]|nr:YciI family protein [Solirubrobacteraceae bacterium]